MQNEKDLKEAKETFAEGSNAQSNLLASRGEFFTVLNQLASELSSAIQEVFSEHASYEGAITTIAQSQHFFDQLKPPEDDPTAIEIKTMVENLFQ